MSVPRAVGPCALTANLDLPRLEGGGDLAHPLGVDGSNLEEVCGQLAAEIAGELRSRSSKRCRFPVGLRSMVVSYARVCRERGEVIADISERLGLEMSTLARWLRSDRTRLEADRCHVHTSTSQQPRGR
jgi:hypothetical protein